jgi:hypothetical protein
MDLAESEAKAQREKNAAADPDVLSLAERFSTVIGKLLKNINNAAAL